jgi:hypothetical protein
MSIGSLDLKVDQNGVAILNQGVSPVTEPGFFAGTLLRYPRFKICSRLVGRVLAPFAMEVHTRIAEVVERVRSEGFSPLGRKALSAAQASISVPAILKCAALVSFNSGASLPPCGKTCRPGRAPASALDCG